MTSPFVPVDLDKLLDEFEENEEVPKPGQQRSVKIEDDSPSDRSLSSHKGPKQCFQPAFPCIQEEVLSDQGSDGRLEDKDDKDDSSSDSSSISGVIEAAEAITNHSQLTTTHKNTGNIISNGHVFPDAHNMVTYTSGNSVSNQEEGSCESDELNYFHNEHVVNNTGSSSYSQGMYTTSPVVDSQNEACHNSISQEGDGRCVLDNTPSNKPEFEQSPGKQQSNSSAEENEINIGSDLDFAISSVTPEQSDLNGMNQSDSSGTHNNLACGSSDSEDRGGSSEEQLVQTTVNSRTSQSPDQSGLHLRSDHGESVYMDDTSRPVDERWTDSDYNTSLAELQNDLHAIELDETRMSDTNLERLSPGGGHALSVHDSDSRHVSFEESTGINTGPFELSNQESSYQDFDPVTEPWEDSVLASQISGSSMGMKAQGFTGARRISSGEACLGRVPPIWVPDSVATHCMNCGLKFSVIKRRHHCRACGKALCSSCCNMKFLLPYLDNREGRVCQVCCNALLRAQALLQVSEEEIDNLESDVTSSLMQVEPEDNCEESALLSNSDQEDLLENGQSMEGAEEEEDHSADFAGVDMTRERTLPVLAPLQLPVPALSLPNTDTPLATPTSPALSDDSDCLFRLDVDNVRSLLPQDITALPPVLSVVNEEITIQERPDPAEIMYQLKGCHETVVFMLNKNLVVKVKIVKLRCCVRRKCWCFVTEGMGAANQEEMVVLLECLDRETMVPKDVLSHFNTAFAYAKQGHTVSELGYTIFGQPFLGNSDNAGFLYVKPTFQCVKNLPLPFTPYVVGVLIRRMETPWAQLFPLRLQLRLGAEYRYYPCPLFSTRNRTAVYGEIGHTIMNLLADFKNFQYTLARVTGLVIHMEENKTVVRLPQDRYDEIVKILNATDEHVMALGANFSQQADSHLVCIQNEQGYKTQAINIQNQARKVTGASFIVFSGALKASSPFTAKVNIVEDGIMVQLMPKVIGELRHALKEMQDYTITSGAPGKTEDELVVVEWISRQEALQETSVCSPIDGLQLDCFPCVKVHSGCDFTRKSVFRIQWTEVFFLGDRRNSSAAWQQCASRDLNQLTAELAKAYCQSLMPHLCRLSNDNSTLIGLRVNLDSDNVGYSTGSNNQCLAGDIMADLDAVLVPVIHSAANRHRGRPLSVELFFKILRLL